VGSAHSALANWLFARSTGGRFLLRIEDTDLERNRPELVDGVLAMLTWLGLEWDEEPVHQSERSALYADAADRLAAAGAAYACDCSAEDVRARNAERGGKPGYDGHCRVRGLAPGAGRALRFRTPDDGSTAWDDLVRGTVAFDHANLEDFVLLRSDGTPTFLLANVVDDGAMAISHVIRGEDHVNGTPKYLLIREALGLGPPPVFAHMPLLVNDSRKKLSKRRDDVSVVDYQQRGFLPEAMCNYLALLGWGPDDGVEVRPIAEIVERYRLEDVNPAPAFFDIKKLTHINAEWIRRLSPDAFAAAAAPFLPAGDAPRRALAALAVEVRDRVRTLDEVPAMIDFLWLDEPEMDEASWDKAVIRGRNAGAMLDATIDGLAALDDWTPESIRAAVEGAAVGAGLVNAEGKPQLAKAQGPVRVAVTGRSVGPPLFESLAQLGRERTLQRLRAARARLG
jgi:glutamyl-tRNA synthetase